MGMSTDAWNGDGEKDGNQLVTEGVCRTRELTGSSLPRAK